MLSCWQRAVVRASTRNRWVSSGWLDCRNLIATRRPSRRSRARNTLPIPPSPINLIISYWLIRTPACGAALCAWTPVETPSNESHADLLNPDGASDVRFDRGCACSVLACGDDTACVTPGGGVPPGIVDGCFGSRGDMPALPRMSEPSTALFAATPTMVRLGDGGADGLVPVGPAGPIVGSCGWRIGPLSEDF